MVVVMQERATESQVEAVVTQLLEMGYDIHRSSGANRVVIGAVGGGHGDPALIGLKEGVHEVLRISVPYKLASRTFKPENTVITIGDVLFETDNAQLRSDGMRNIDKLAGFLVKFPRRSALIEGFTDSTGSDSHNQALSGRRADAVRTAMVDRGVGRDRLSTRGYGEAYPVAGNDSSSGRQMNRRVEIILSDEGGSVTPR